MIGLTYNGDVAILTLAHGKANAMDIEFCRALIEQFNKLAKSPAKAVVLTGQGRIFSAGVNLIRARDGGAAYLRKFLPVLNKLFDTVFYFPKPVVAAINGHAIAGGCVLACCADLRVMARDGGRIGVTELLVGLPYPALAFEVMRFVAMPCDLAEIIYSGATYPADAAADRGLVDEIVERAVLLEQGIAAAQALVALAPAAFALTKQQLRLPVTDRMKKDGRKIDAAVTKIWTTKKSVDNIRDYVARTFKKS